MTTVKIAIQQQPSTALTVAAVGQPAQVAAPVLVTHEAGRLTQLVRQLWVPWLAMSALSFFVCAMHYGSRLLHIHPSFIAWSQCVNIFIQVILWTWLLPKTKKAHAAKVAARLAANAYP